MSYTRMISGKMSPQTCTLLQPAAIFGQHVVTSCVYCMYMYTYIHTYILIIIHIHIYIQMYIYRIQWASFSTMFSLKTPNSRLLNPCRHRSARTHMQIHSFSKPQPLSSPSLPSPLPPLSSSHSLSLSSIFSRSRSCVFVRSLSPFLVLSLLLPRRLAHLRSPTCHASNRRVCESVCLYMYIYMYI